MLKPVNISNKALAFFLFVPYIAVSLNCFVL